ncbi:MAG: hypothetical protein ACRCSG_07670 [Cellulosilyticaceae bacterium]
MNMIYFMLIVLYLSAIVVLMGTIIEVRKTKYKVMNWIVTIMCAFSMMRYLTLIVYGGHPTLGQLEALRYFYLATSIGLTVPLALAVWYMTPYLRERIQYGKFLLYFTPWIVGYIVLIIKQPTVIQMSKSGGYVLELLEPWKTVLSVLQGSYVVFIALMCVIGWFTYKHSQLRSQYFIIVLALIALTIDGLSFLTKIPTIFPPFTLSEIFTFIAITYVFKNTIVKKIDR